MMEENFRRIADAVRLPEGSRARIRAQIASRAEEQEASMQNKPQKRLIIISTIRRFYFPDYPKGSQN